MLITQCLYSPHVNSLKTRQPSVTSTGTEEEPLLRRRRSSDTIGLPGSHRRRSSARSGRRDSLSKILEEDDEDGNTWMRNVLSILGVIAVGTAGWAIAWQSGVWTPTPDDGGLMEPTKTALGAKILGYASAVCYLG